MNKNSTQYMFLFALLICVVCSFLLSFVSEKFKDKRELNISLDIKKNILKAVELKEPLPAKATPQQILTVYEQSIEETIVDASGNIIEGKALEDITEENGLFPIYIYKDSGQIISYCFPLKGSGLWGPLYAYLALESDAVTVRGITYYITPDFKETPGLGAEVTTDWFQGNFKGKKIWDIKNMELKPIAVVKGKVSEKVSDQEKAKHFVDGISGATITSRGVTEMIDRELRKYEPYFKKLRK